jgi:uncharacterized membrane protein
MGLLAGVIVTFLFGLALNAFLVRKTVSLAETALNRIPLVRNYGVRLPRCQVVAPAT